MGKLLDGIFPLVAILVVLFIFSKATSRAIEEGKGNCGDVPGSEACKDQTAERSKRSVDDSDEYDHHIEKRSAAAPDNVTFTLTKKSPYESTTEMYIGSRVAFQLDIVFPDGTTDMNVELFTPDNETTVMILCDVIVKHTGSSLSITGTTTPTMDSRTPGSILYDRAVINLGNVTNSGCASQTDCKITIEWEAVMLDNNDTTNGTTYYVSAGAEYNNEDEIWVGQAPFTTITDDTEVTDTPSFNFTGPDQMAIGSGALFDIVMYLPYPSGEVVFNAFSPLNTSSVMSICSTRLKSYGTNFKCGFDANSVATKYYDATTGIGNAIGQLSLGQMLNKGSRDTNDPKENSLVTIQFAAHLYNTPSFVGEKFKLGAAFEFGKSKIWAGQVEVTAVAAQESLSMNDITMEFSYDNDQVAIGQPKKFQLKVAVPDNSTANYELTLEAPFNDSKAVFQLCSVQLGEIGMNMGCVSKDKYPTYSSRETGSNQADKAVLNLGGLTNVAFEDSGTNPNASIMTFDIIVNPLNHTLATVGSKHKVSASMKYAGSRLTVAYVELEVQAAISAESNVSVPGYNMTGVNQVEVGTSARMLYEIETETDVKYPVAKIELITPSSNTSTLFSVCRAKIISAGKNLPCVTPAWINSKVEYTSKYNNINNRAVMDLTTLCNVALYNETDENKLVIAVDYTVLDDTELADGTKSYVSAGHMYQEDKIWVGQKAVTSKRTGNVGPTTTPHISLIDNTTSVMPLIPYGYTAVYTVLIKVPPEEHMDLKIDVSSTKDGLYVCGLRIKDTGDNLPCVKKETKPTFETFPSGLNQKGSLNISYTSNLGTDKLVKNDVYDSNTLLVEINMKLTTDTSLVSEGATFPFTTDVTYASSGTKKSFSKTVTATANTSALETNVTKSPTYTFSIGEIGENDNSTEVAKGEAKRFILDIMMPEEETLDLTIRFLTPVSVSGHMEICGAAVIDIGENFACLDKSKIDATLESRTGSSYKDIASIKLGYIRNTGLASGTAGRIRVEAVAKLLNNQSLSAGDKVKFSAAVNINDMQIYVSQIDLTVTDTFVNKNSSGIQVNETLLYVNSTEDVLSLKIGQITTIEVVANVPPLTSSNVKFDLDFRVNDTVVAIVKDVRLVRTGTNIACLYPKMDLNSNFPPTYNSSDNSCAKDNAEINFKIVTNAGLSHRKGTYQYGDNSVVIEVDVMLVDFEGAENGTITYLSFGIKESIYIAICNKKVAVLREGTEKPDLELKTELNETLSTKFDIYFDVLLSHKNTSTARCSNTSINLFMPEYVTFKEVVSHSLSQTPTVTTDNNVIVQFQDLLICDALSLTLRLEPNNSFNVPMDIYPEKTVVVVDAVCSTQSRSGSVYASDKTFSADMAYVNFSITVTQDESCKDSLGLEHSDIVKDCQLSASIENPQKHPPSHGRLDGGNQAWQPFLRSAVFSKYRYFQVYWGNRTLVDKYVVQQGPSGFAHQPTELILSYSDDGSSWDDVETVDIPILTPFVNYSFHPTRPTIARYVRIYISKDNSNGNPPQIGLRFGFYGCQKTADVKVEDICQTQVTSTKGYYWRSFLVDDSDDAYMCDTNHRKNMRPECTKSLSGNKYKQLDSQIGSMMGFDGEKNRLYAYHTDMKTVMMSTDSGHKWESVSIKDFHDARDFSSKFTPALNVPFTTDKLYLSQPHQDYRIKSWGACYDGMYKNIAGIWTKVYMWDN